MTILRALVSGAIGAGILTLIHETARQVIPSAPRMDIVGMRAIAAALRKGGASPPPSDRLHPLALAGDLLSNSIYYSLVALGNERRLWLRGVALGGAAGLGAVVLTPLLGLGEQPVKRTATTQLMTFTWYLVGGLAAAAAARFLRTSQQHD